MKHSILTLSMSKSEISVSKNNVQGLSCKPSWLNLKSLFNRMQFTTRLTCSGQSPPPLLQKALVKIWQKEPHLSTHLRTIPGDDASQALKKRPEIEPKFPRGPTGEHGQVFTVLRENLHNTSEKIQARMSRTTAWLGIFVQVD